MILWFDANLSPQIARWVEAMFGIPSRHFDDLGCRLATDRFVFEAAKQRGHVVIVTNDADYVRLLEQFGPPPALLWLTTGNTSNAALRALFTARLGGAVALFEAGEPLVELG